MVLLDALCIQKEEQLVFDKRSTERTSELVALEGRVGAVERSESGMAVLKVIEKVPVDAVRPLPCRHQYLSSRCKVTRHVLVGTVDLELTDGTFGYIHHRSSYILVGDVLTIEDDPCGAA